MTNSVDEMTEIYVRTLCADCETEEDQNALGTISMMRDIDDIIERTEASLKMAGWKKVGEEWVCAKCFYRHEDDDEEADYYRDLHEEEWLLEEYDE